MVFFVCCLVLTGIYQVNKDEPCLSLGMQDRVNRELCVCKRAL